MLVAIEGIDGAGKGTLTANLARLAGTTGVRMATLSFPRYQQTKFAQLIEQYLNGRFGALGDVPVRFAALLYAGDRYESLQYLRELLAGNELVILDRYVASNVAYNAAKLPLEARAELIDWIVDTEFDLFELPEPELTCLVATSPAVADGLLEKKGVRDYTDATRDLHEADRAFMDDVAQVYEQLCAANVRSRWFRCATQAANGTLRSPEDIAAEVWRQIDAARTGVPS